MELEQFVTETLRQIMAGVKKAQAESEPFGASVNPQPMGHSDQKTKHLIANNSTVIQDVEFDVALSAESGSETKRGLALVVASLGAGTSSKRESQSSIVNRVKFVVPVSFAKGTVQS